MKLLYPVIIEHVQDAHPYVVTIPDLTQFTEGDSLANAIAMARDAIGLYALDGMDNLPRPSELAAVKATAPAGAIVTLVDIDLLAYKRKHDSKPWRKH